MPEIFRKFLRTKVYRFIFCAHLRFLLNAVSCEKQRFIKPISGQVALREAVNVSTQAFLKF